MPPTIPNPITPLLSASVLLLDAQGQVLLVKRKRGPGVCMPGGKVEPGEDIRQAAVREVLEETGLRLKPVDLHVIYRGPCPSEEGLVYEATTLMASRWAGDLGGEEPELEPYWGRWKELVENSPFGQYNQSMAWEGFVVHLGKSMWWTPQMDRWMAAMMDDLDMSPKRA